MIKYYMFYCYFSVLELKQERSDHMENKNSNDNLIRFLLTFFLGWIGSLVINHSQFKPQGWKSRTLAYLFLTMITFGIYQLVASIMNLTFDPEKPSNIGYFKDGSE